MLRVGLADAEARLPDLVEAALKGEVVIIGKEGREAVQLLPVTARWRRQFGSARGLIVMSEDLDAPLSDFEAHTAIPSTGS